MHVLVTGAGGFVARHLIPDLRQDGHQVTAMRRTTASLETPWPSDLRDIETWPYWPDGIDAVVHLAAANPDPRDAGAGNAEALLCANTQATAALAHRAAREGVSHFVFLSTANVHGPSAASPVCESDPVRPHSPYAASKAAAEVALKDALAGTETTFCILRPAPVFGLAGRGNVALLARLAIKPWPIPLKALAGRRSIVAVEDLVRAISLALTDARAVGETLLIAGGALTPAEIVTALRAGRMQAERLLPLPTAALGMLAGWLGKGEAFANLTSDFVVNSARARDRLGWEPETDLTASLGAFARVASGSGRNPRHSRQAAQTAEPKATKGTTGLESAAVAIEDIKPLRILLVTQYFWPETFAINEVVDELRALGCDITVLTGHPNYPDGRTFPGYAAWKAGVQPHPNGYEIIRVPILPRGEGGLRRVANYASFVLSASAFAPFLLRGRRYDVVFVYAVSPILQALPAIVLGRLKKAPLVVWVQDLWPDTLRSTGFVTNERILSLIGLVTRYIYRRCDLILAQSSGFVDRIRHLAGPHARIETQYNSGQAIVMHQQSQTAALQLDPGFNIVFAGNLGKAQSLETILGAAEQLRDLDCRFVLVGSGSQLASLRDEIAQRGLQSHVQLAGRFPAADMPHIFSQASALVVTLASSPTLALTIPSKVPTYLGAGRPILASLDGEAAEIINSSGAGFAVAAEDFVALAGAVRQLIGMPAEQREAMGAAGKAYFAEHFQQAKLAAALKLKLSSVV